MNVFLKLSFSGACDSAALEAALQHNPHYVDAMLFLADRNIDAENYDEAGDLLDQVDEVNAKQPNAWAYRAVLAHLANRPERELEFRNRALKWWSTNPEIDHLIGRKLSQKYRLMLLTWWVSTIVVKSLSASGPIWFASPKSMDCRWCGRCGVPASGLSSPNGR